MSKKRKRGPLVLRLKFGDDDELMKLSDAIYQTLLQAAAIVRSPPEEFNAETRVAAERRLRNAAEAVAEREGRRLAQLKVADPQTLKVARGFKTDLDAAVELEISERQLRERLKRIAAAQGISYKQLRADLKAARKNRKS